MNSKYITRSPENFGPRHVAFWLVLLAALIAVGAYFKMFMGFQSYDDEGTLMISVKEYLGGMRIYQEVFSIYGPIYYLYNLFVHTLTGTAVSHDVTRVSSLFLWLAASLLSAGITLRLTKSLVLAAASLFLVSSAVRYFHSEPGHPQELTLVLVIALAGCPLWADLARRRSVLMVAMGSLAGALLLIKVNVGLFALAALALALLAHSPRRPLFRYIGYAVGAGCILLSPALMWHQRDAAWAQTYCLLATASISAAVFCLLKLPWRSLVNW